MKIQHDDSCRIVTFEASRYFVIRVGIGSSMMLDLSDTEPVETEAEPHRDTSSAQGRTRRSISKPWGRKPGANTIYEGVHVQNKHI